MYKCLHGSLKSKTETKIDKIMKSIILSITILCKNAWQFLLRPNYTRDAKYKNLSHYL